MQVDVVDDGECAGTGGVSWGGLLLRRASATESGGEVAIGWLWWAMRRGEVARLLREERGVERRAPFEGRGAPYIVARRGRGCGEG
jgi:hypothetical protein